MSKRLVLAIQNKGRLGAQLPTFFEKAGLSFDIKERKLYSPCRNFPLDLLLIRHRDILNFVESGQADLGIVGSDMYEEKRSSLEVVLSLGMARCTLKVAVLKSSGVEKVEQLDGKRVATTFPNVVDKFFKERGLNVHIIEVGGSVEVTPQMGMADAIADLVGTGSTLRMHGLKPIHQIFRAEAIMVARNLLLEWEKKLLDELVIRFESVRIAKEKRYLMFNIKKDRLEKIRKIIPGLSGPSVIRLDKSLDGDWVAVHVVVDEGDIWNKIPKLKEKGASGILVSAIDNVVY